MIMTMARKRDGRGKKKGKRVSWRKRSRKKYMWRENNQADNKEKKQWQ